MFEVHCWKQLHYMAGLSCTWRAVCRCVRSSIMLANNAPVFSPMAQVVSPRLRARRIVNSAYWCTVREDPLRSGSVWTHRASLTRRLLKSSGWFDWSHSRSFCRIIYLRRAFFGICSNAPLCVRKGSYWINPFVIIPDITHHPDGVLY